MKFKGAPKDVRVDLWRLVGGAAGTLIALMVASWPSDALTTALVGVAGLVLGFAAAVGVEYVVGLHQEVERLSTIESDEAAAKELREEERLLWQYQLECAQRRFLVAEIGTKVWAGLAREVAPDPSVLSSFVARQQSELQAKNINRPLGTFEEWREGKG